MVKVIEDPKYGYKKLSNIPEKKYIKQFYQRHYHEKKQQETCKVTNDIETEFFEAISDEEWNKQTSFLEAKIIFEKNIGENKKSLLDIGCGYGDFLSYFAKEGWQVEGVEPSISASKIAQAKGLRVHSITIEDWVNVCHGYSCINLANVLEHLEDPLDTLKSCKKMLNPGGLIRIRVPNDFNELQLIANKKVQRKNWWISIPDHINYFTFDSLEMILRDLGFEVVHRTTDFPMEIFLLMGDNYVDNPEIGPICHNKRKLFDLSLTLEERERFYKKLAESGLGRHIILYGKLV